MTWGTHCPMCGLEDCAWVNGMLCEGKLRLRRACGYAPVIIELPSDPEAVDRAILDVLKRKREVLHRLKRRSMWPYALALVVATFFAALVFGGRYVFDGDRLYRPAPQGEYRGE